MSGNTSGRAREAGVISKQPTWASGLRRRRSTIVLCLLGIVGATLAVLPIYAGDNYCGRLLFDSSAQPSCKRALGARTVIVAGIMGPSLAGLVVEVMRKSNQRLPVGFLLAGCVITVTLVVIGLNRLLEPTDGLFCGSVLNRHRSFDSAVRAACEGPIAARTRSALLAFAGAAAVSACTVLLRVALRRPH